MKPAVMPAGYFGWQLLDGERGHTVLRDTLHNLSTGENGEDHRYGQGLLVGVVGTLLACGMTFEDACQLAWQHMPDDVHPDRVPGSWIDHFRWRIKR